MEQLKDKKPISHLFILTGLFLLFATLTFGVIGALQYVFPGLYRNAFSFEKIRPLHVSSAVFWILMTAIGSVLFYLSKVRNGLWSIKLPKWQWVLFTSAVMVILITYTMGIFGGREYWEFHPYLALPIILAWILFLINVIKTIKNFRKQPVYIWMWLTGTVFFLFTYLESYLWLIPYFRSNIVHDMTIQWKSYGSMVGCWNMLIYGCSIYLMDKISGSDKYSYSSISFALYFLGLFNLMFNWGHHIYTLPAPKYIQYVSYGVSMTELLLLGRIIYFWKSSVNTARKHYHILSYRFLLAADLWIFLTLILAIAMSIPAINIYTHGTHITVAHTMGATIGINTFLLLALVCNIFNIHKPITEKQVTTGLYITLIALPIFWISLIIAGVLKSNWQMHHTNEIPFSAMMQSLHPFFVVFLISGILLTVGFYIIIGNLLAAYFKKTQEV